MAVTDATTFGVLDPASSHPELLAQMLLTGYRNALAAVSLLGLLHFIN